MTFEELEKINESLNADYLKLFDEQYNGWECGLCHMPFKTNFIVTTSYLIYFLCNKCTERLKDVWDDTITLLTDQDVFTLRLIGDLPSK